jgi:hypothetical protein
MEREDIGRVVAVGVTFYAGLMMIMGGIFQVIQGLTALFGNGFFAVPHDYAFTVDENVWGWVHLVLGLLVAAAGVYLFVGKLWARLVGIAAAVLGVIANFLFIPYYPIWSILIIIFDLVAIWVLAFHGREVAEITGGDV